MYLEPCAGSMAVLLGRPTTPRTEIVCDTSGLICNFWRAMQSDPEGIARKSDYPTIHQDLTARHRWLMKWARENAGRLSEDPEYHDLQAAGWWAWGVSSWPGSGWCLINEEKRPTVHEGGGQGIQAQRGELTGEVGTGERLMPWFRDLARRLARVAVLNQDWKKAVTLTSLQDHRRGECLVSIFLDPPYRTQGRKQTLYQSDLEGTSDQTAEETWEWARFTGEKYRLRLPGGGRGTAPGLGGNQDGVSRSQQSGGPGKTGHDAVLAGMYRTPAVPVRAGLLIRSGPADQAK